MTIVFKYQTYLLSISEWGNFSKSVQTLGTYLIMDKQLNFTSSSNLSFSIFVTQFI
jgi:hypothetical protein